MSVRHAKSDVDSLLHVPARVQELPALIVELDSQRDCYSRHTVACVELALDTRDGPARVALRRARSSTVITGILDQFSHIGSRQMWVDGHAASIDVFPGAPGDNLAAIGGRARGISVTLCAGDVPGGLEFLWRSASPRARHRGQGFGGHAGAVVAVHARAARAQSA